MDLSEQVDPEVLTSISNLVSALGGVDSETGVYKLGDDALGCLRDLRKWLQNYDAKYDRLEVSCAIASTTLVPKDIPAILSLWEKSSRHSQDPYLDRVALACLELLVPLTWPIDIFGKEAAVEQFSQSLFLRANQVKYKRAIVSYSTHNILISVIKLAAGAMRIPLKDREPRDEGVLSLVCSFFRNILAIENESDQDRALVVKEFKQQKVLSFLLSISSGMGSQFDTQDTVLLETIYYLIRSVDIRRLYGAHVTEDNYNTSRNLKQMLETEEDMNRIAFKPTRHSRFGTLISLNYGGGGQVSLSGQRGVAGLDASVSQMDFNKRWHKPRERAVNDENEKSSFMPQLSSINGNNDALTLIREFTDNFLDSSFNPVFSKVRKLIERMASPRVSKKICIIFCYLLGWFIDAERTRAKIAEQPVDFELIGDALTKDSFAVVTKLLAYGLEMGEMRSTDLVHSSMFAFRQILLSVRDMSYSDDEDLREIADGMKSRLFYEDQWLTILSRLPRSSHRKSLVYACESIALTHVILKMLDEYSKQHTYIFVKTNRLRQKSKNVGDGPDLGVEIDDIDAMNDHREAARVTNERKFVFEKFLLKYINDPTISVYERALENFKEVGNETVLQVFSFFRRTFAKTSCKAVFYRMSLMKILLLLVDRQGLPADSRTRRVAEEFLTYFVRRFVATSSSMPSLHIQVNEIITPADAFYYDHGGQDKQRFRAPIFEYTLTSKATREFSPERQIAVLVAALIDNDRGEHVKWIEETLMDIVNENNDKPKSGREFKTLSLNADKMKAVHGDGLLRLLLRSLGLIVNPTQGKVVLPGNVDELELLDKLQWIGKYQSETVEFPRGKTAQDYIKREGDADPVDYDDEDGEDLGVGGSLATAGDKEAVQRNGSAEERVLLSSNSPSSPQVSPVSGETMDPAPEPDLSTQSKRSHFEAFALEPSDGELSENDDVAKSIQAVRKRKTVLDDDDDDED